MKNPFLSICVLSYNRENKSGNIYQLLKSIDTQYVSDIEIVICDDKSPLIAEVREDVAAFKKETKYAVAYFENERNLGFDGNLKELIRKSMGEWIMYMGDDDHFVPGALDKFIAFMKAHNELGYILKSHYTMRRGGTKEKFRYYNGTKFFEPGLKTYVDLFRKSVFISGFTIKRAFLPELIDDFDHSLLFQNYLLAEVVLKYPAAYFDEPLTQQYDDNAHMVTGRAGKRIMHYKRSPSIATSINFLKSFVTVPRYIDRKYSLNSTPLIQKDMSKYLYPSLALHRDKGIRIFLDYVKELNALRFNCTVYYYLYVLLLLIFRKRICDWGVVAIKKIFGKTPRL